MRSFGTNRQIDILPCFNRDCIISFNQIVFSQIMGVGVELKPHYFYETRKHRKKYPNSTAGLLGKTQVKNVSALCLVGSRFIYLKTGKLFFVLPVPTDKGFCNITDVMCYLDLDKAFNLKNV